MISGNRQRSGIISPSKSLFWLILMLIALSLPASIFEFEKWWWRLSAFAGLILVIDLISGIFQKPVGITRSMDRTFPLGVWSTVTLTVSNARDSPMRIEIFDHVPQSMRFLKLPAVVFVSGNSHRTFNYSIYPEERGDFRFNVLQTRQLSRLKFWQLTRKISLRTECRVYPNFSAVSQYALLAMENKLGQLGINQYRRRGEGLEFHQLREYQQGDPLKKVDWKATSKHRKLISKEFNDERNQEIMLMIDCGHRMRTKDGELSHFDHSLNAALLLSYVALRQGDAVGLGLFSRTHSDSDRRWLRPTRGPQTLQRILNSVYDIQPGTQAPDYSTAAKTILMRQKKRALIIFITNIRDEDNDDLRAALLLLNKRHLVLVASLREKILDNTKNQKVQDFNDAIRVCAAHEYLRHRKTTFDQIRAINAQGFDVSPDKLSIKLVNDYLKIKSAGML